MNPKKPEMMKEAGMSFLRVFHDWRQRRRASTIAPLALNVALCPLQLRQD
jgi:hypothetical protein